MVKNIATTNLNIRTDKVVKEKAEEIFNELGLSMTTAISIFLRQTIRDNGIPFDLKLKPNDEIVVAIKGGQKLAKDSSAKGYDNMEDLIEELES